MNAQQFAAKLNDTLDGGLALRPFNRYDPTDTIWWMVPSNEWPAFKCSKLFVNPTDDTEVFEVGLYLEKGHGVDVLLVNGDTPGNRTQVMDISWAWEKITRNNIDDCCEIAKNIENAGLQPKVRLEIYPFITDRSNPDAIISSQCAIIKYDCIDETTNLVYQEDLINDSVLTTFISKVSGQSSITGILKAINEFDDSKWYWMNVLVYFETKAIDSNTEAALSSALALVSGEVKNA